MAKIKVAELFYSIQGEGEYVGVPSVFLRTFGCNFSCAGFGMPRGELSEERNAIDPKAYTSYDSLPLVHTGCDSYASWDPRFKHLSPMIETSEIAKRIYEMVPNNKMSSGQPDGKDIHLIITGGEPLLGWQRAYPDLLRAMPDVLNVTFETNGTQELSQSLIDFFNNERPELQVTWSVSAKLSSASGEARDEALQPDIVARYLEVKQSQLYFKFVCATEENLQEALEYKAAYEEAGIDVPVYLMAAGGTDKLYFYNAKQVAELAMKHALRYSPRIQVDVFKNAWGT